LINAKIMKVNGLSFVFGGLFGIAILLVASELTDYTNTVETSRYSDYVSYQDSEGLVLTWHTKTGQVDIVDHDRACRLISDLLESGRYQLDRSMESYHELKFLMHIID